MDLFIPDNTIRPEIMPLLAPLVPEPERFRLEGVDAADGGGHHRRRANSLHDRAA